MPRGLKRYPGQVHFLTFSCHERLPYLGTGQARDLFVEQLRSVSQRYQFEVIGYVVMPEHVHLLVTEPKTSPLSSAIQALKVSVAKRSSQKPFWLRNYYDFNILRTGKIEEKLEYMRQNPVVRGLVSSPERWAWSSDQFPIEP